MKPTLEDIFKLHGFPAEHKHDGPPPTDAKIVEKWGQEPGSFERAIKTLGSIRVKVQQKTIRYDLYFYYDGYEYCLALTKERVGQEEKSTRSRR